MAQAEQHNQMALRMAVLNTVALANSSKAEGVSPADLISQAEQLLAYVRTGEPNATA